MSEILVAKNITKIYGIGTSHTFEALHGVSMTMNEGEFICVMGPSGAGKSTFINNLSTILSLFLKISQFLFLLQICHRKK